LNSVLYKKGGKINKYIRKKGKKNFYKKGKNIACLFFLPE